MINESDDIIETCPLNSESYITLLFALDLYFGGPSRIRHTHPSLYLTAHSAPQPYTLYPLHQLSLTPFVLHTTNVFQDEFPWIFKSTRSHITKRIHIKSHNNFVVSFRLLGLYINFQLVIINIFLKKIIFLNQIQSYDSLVQL